MSAMQKTNSAFCFTKVYIILLIIVSLQIAICVWVGRLQQNLNETKQSLMNTYGEYRFQKGFVKNESRTMSLKQVQDKTQRKNKSNKIKEVIVLAPLKEFYKDYVIFNETISIWQVDEISGSLSLHENAYVEIGVDGFYQINAMLRLKPGQPVKEFYSYYLCKNKSILASTTFTSSQSTGIINIVTQAQKGDRLFLSNPWKGLSWFVKKEVTFFSIHHI
ncbi:uncharacterized protein LOC100205401 [Hydra vulgaris]|uniref:uncharacterized protein LOC100205401 n=1 Tax=Hydra vulgaris TaxID=6087 RepID=UPI000640F04F|nr:uncharacterized protein LOC100205401 [Hydra vulgaris]